MGADQKNRPAEPSAARLCRDCHQRGGGCCRLGKNDTSHMFGLTVGEVAAIAQAGGLTLEKFLVRDQAPPDFLNFLTTINPILARAMPGGRRIRLKVDEKGNCVFLGPEGCGLPQAARPLYCRAYPFCLTRGGRLMVLINDTCLAQKDARSWQDVMARLGEDEARVRAVFQAMKKLIKNHEGPAGEDLYKALSEAGI